MKIKHFTLKNCNVYNSVMASHITKSRILSGLRCQKRLWLKTFQPGLAEQSSTAQLIIVNGIELGNMARLAYPGGILIEHVEHPDLAVAQTARLIANDPPVLLFEAAFVHADALVCCDIINPETDQSERYQEIHNLLKYCELDTQAMVEVVKYFED